MVERLTALEAAATPGPWESFVDFGNQESHVRTPKWSASLGLAARTADAALIVAMRNDLPALLSQLREQRELLRVNQDAHKKCDVLMAELGRQLTAAERTVREQREALAVLGRIASYDPRWVGMHVNDAPGRAKIIAMAYDAIAALAPNTEGEGT
jgi:hypothetical protein